MENLQNETTSRLYGGIEAGGTKFVCAVGTGPNDIREEIRFPTTRPQETLTQAIDFFKKYDNQLAAIGVAAFGPVDLNPKSATYGFITTTPKPYWANTSVVGTLQQALNLPIGFDTDVNGAALGEGRWGAAINLDTFIYLTIGTGIGGGGVSNGHLLRGLVHPEMGHIYVPHNREVDPFNGTCPFHGDCLEGMASGPAMEARWGQAAHTLPPDHPAWMLEAHYLALALANFVCTLSPERIVMGGGVMSQPHLFGMVRAELQKLLNGYVQNPAILEHINQFVVSPALGPQAGVLGAIALAMNADLQALTK